MKMILLSFMVGMGGNSQMAIQETDCPKAITEIVDASTKNPLRSWLNVVKFENGVHISYQENGEKIRHTLICTQVKEE